MAATEQLCHANFLHHDGERACPNVIIKIKHEDRLIPFPQPLFDGLGLVLIKRVNGVLP